MSNNTDLIARLIDLGLTRLPCGSYQVGTTDAAMADREAALEGITHTNDVTKALCAWQLRSYGAYKDISLGTNFYGYAVHDYMGANIRGGRASITARGISLARAIEVGARQVEDGVPGWRRFTFPAALRRFTPAPDGSDLSVAVREFAEEVEAALAAAA
jgi:hypothetical protein